MQLPVRCQRFRLSRTRSSTGSFYTYFKTKEDAFAAVMAEVHEETLHPRLEASTESEDPRAAIDAANRAYLKAYRRNARLMVLIEQVALIDERFLQLRLKRAHAFAERNAAAIARLQARGLADPALDPFGAALGWSGPGSVTPAVGAGLPAGAQPWSLLARLDNLFALGL